MFFGGGDIGAWRIVLSSRAYGELQRYREVAPQHTVTTYATVLLRKALQNRSVNARNENA